MSRRHSVALSVEHADGTAVILRERREFWLSGYADTGGVRLDGHLPHIHGLEHDRTAVGGLLPAGALNAEIVDRVGLRHRAAVAHGVWLTVLDELAGPLPPVRYSDARGRTVPQPVPAGWQRRPLPNADESCPACRAVSWDQVIPPRGERGRRIDLTSGNWEPMPITVCRECGHDLAAGANCTEIGDFPWATKKRGSTRFLSSLRAAVRRSGPGRDIG